MKDKPKRLPPPVTILIPTFNRRKFLPLALKSALGQTYRNIFVLVFDDGSTDGTFKWLFDIPDERLTVIAGKQKQGVAHARQVLLNETKTEFNAWLDSDDMRNIYSIELQMEAMKKWKPPFVRTSTEILDGQDGKRWRRIPSVAYSKRHSIATSLFRKSCAPKFRTDLRFFGEDIVWEMDMTIKHGTGIMLPFECYYIGRGRHGRLTAGVKSKPKIKNKAYYEKLKAERRIPLRKMGINGTSRVERIAADAIKLPFTLPVTTNVELPDIFKVANWCTSRRTKAAAGLYRINRCPLCGFRLNGVICSQCGHDWSGQGWVPQARQLPEPVQEGSETCLSRPSPS